MLRVYVGMIWILVYFKVKEEIEINDRFRSVLHEHPKTPSIYDAIKIVFMICCPFVNVLFATVLLITICNHAAWNEVIEKVIEDREQGK